MGFTNIVGHFVQTTPQKLFIDEMITNLIQNGTF